MNKSSSDYVATHAIFNVMMISIFLGGSVKHVTAWHHSPLVVGLQNFELVQDLLDILILVEEIVGLAVVLVQR